MRSPAITHPAKERLIIIRQWQVEFSDGNHCAAALLSFFEYWHSIKEEMRIKARQENDAAERNGKRRTQDESLLQHHSAEELSEGLTGLFKRDAIRTARQILISKGAITEHRNPDPEHSYDNTVHYLFHPEICQNWINDPIREIAQAPAENQRHPGGKPQVGLRKTDDLLQRLHPETTAESYPAGQAPTGKNGHHDDKEGFKLEPETPTLEQQTWTAYSQEFRKRYRTDPVRNAKTNAQIKQLTARLGKETPDVAAFYLHHNAQFYVQKCHAVGNLLADAEKLRTEWATGTRITNTRAQQADKSQSNQDLIAEARRHFERNP